MLRTLILLILFCLSPNLDQTASAETGPRVEVPETVFEFPPVPEGVPVVHDFVVYNRGDQPLDILKVKAG